MIRWYIKLLPFFVVTMIAKRMNLPWKATRHIWFVSDWETPKDRLISDLRAELAAARQEVERLKQENYNLQHSITQAIDPERTDVSPEQRKAWAHIGEVIERRTKE